MKEKPQAAVQCGPLLIDAGKPVAGLNDSRIARRTFAAVDGKGRAMLGVSSGVSLAQLSQVLGLTNIAGRFRAARALNLDGGGSATLWVDGRVVNNPSQGYERPAANSLILIQRPKK